MAFLSYWFPYDDFRQTKTESLCNTYGEPNGWFSLSASSCYERLSGDAYSSGERLI